MHRIVEREMTPDDQKRLFACLPPVPSPFQPFTQYAYGLHMIGEAFGVFMFFFVFVVFGDWHWAYGIVGWVACLAAWWLLHLRSRVLVPLRRWKDANRRIWAFHDAVAKAQTIRVHRVEADSVVKITYDEGMICLFDVGPGQTCWIDPYCMIPGRPPKNWPSRAFEVVEIAGWQEMIGPFCEGKRLRPRDTFEFRDLFEHYDFEPPPDGLIHQSVDAFIAEAKSRNQTTGKLT